MLQSTGALQLTSTGGLNNAGALIAGGDLSLDIVGLQNQTAGLLQSGGTLSYSGVISTQAGDIAADTPGAHRDERLHQRRHDPGRFGGRAS